MNMETAGGRQNPEKRELDEAEPSLPTDPTEAAAWLEEVWKRNGGWGSQHPLRLKVKNPKDYQEMSEDEKRQLDELGKQFTWLAEMHRSEMGWSQSYTRTNHGEVFGFRFGYEVPKNPEDNIPEAYVFRPFDEGKPEVFIRKDQDGWKAEPLSEVAGIYTKNFSH